MCFTLAGISPSSIGNTSSKFKTYPFSPNLNVKYMSCHFPAILPLDPGVMLTYASWSIHPSIHPSPDLPTTPSAKIHQGSNLGLWDHICLCQAWNTKNILGEMMIIYVFLMYISIHTLLCMYIYIYLRQKFSFSGILILQWYLPPYIVSVSSNFLLFPPLVPLWGSRFVHASHGRRPAPMVAADNLPRGQNMWKAC